MKTADDVIDWLEEILDAPAEVTHREAQRIAKALRLLDEWEKDIGEMPETVSDKLWRLHTAMGKSKNE